jgi:hypothetical protein
VFVSALDKSDVDYKNATSLSIMKRALDILGQYNDQFNLDIALKAFPFARIRVITPSEDLPSNMLLFDTEGIKKMINVGIKDGISFGQSENALSSGDKMITLNEYLNERV